MPSITDFRNDGSKDQTPAKGVSSFCSTVFVCMIGILKIFTECLNISIIYHTVSVIARGNKEKMRCSPDFQKLSVLPMSEIRPVSPISPVFAAHLPLNQAASAGFAFEEGRGII